MSVLEISSERSETWHNGCGNVEIYFKQCLHDEVNKKVNRTLRRTTRLRKKRQ